MIRLSLLECRDPIGSRHSLCSPIALASLLPSIISGGAGLLGSIFGGFSQNKNTKQTNATNLQIARETNQMSLDAMREQNQFNRDMALEMFDRENAYNDPSAQAQRLLNAGFSPAVAFGNGAMAQSLGNISTPTASGLPNFVSPTMQTPPSVMLSAVDSISKLAGASAQLAQAKKTNKEASWIDADMDAQIRLMFQEMKNKAAEQKYTEVLSDIQQAYGKDERASQIAKNYMECYTLYLKGETEKADAKWKNLEADISDIKKDRERELSPIIIQEARESVKLIQKQQNVADSQAASNYGSAALSRQLVNESESREKLNDQQYKFIDETWEWSKAGIEASTRGQQLSNMYDRETLLARIDNTLKLPGLTEESRKELEQRRISLEKNNSVFNKRFALEVLGDVLGAYESLSRTGKNQSDVVSNAVPYFLRRQ